LFSSRSVVLLILLLCVLRVHCRLGDCFSLLANRSCARPYLFWCVCFWWGVFFLFFVIVVGVLLCFPVSRWLDICVVVLGGCLLDRDSCLCSALFLGGSPNLVRRVLWLEYWGSALFVVRAVCSFPDLLLRGYLGNTLPGCTVSGLFVPLTFLCCGGFLGCVFGGRFEVWSVCARMSSGYPCLNMRAVRFAVGIYFPLRRREAPVV